MSATERVELLRHEYKPTVKPKRDRRPLVDCHRQRRQGRQFCRLVAEGVSDAGSQN